MRRKIGTFAIFMALAWCPVARAWNTGPRLVNAIDVKADGSAWFTLFESGESGGEFFCSEAPLDPWLKLGPCGAADGACREGASRIVELLRQAKEAHRPLSITQVDCHVSEVAQKDVAPHLPASADVDSDGISNTCETSGCGPIRPSDFHTSPDKADLFLVVCRQPGVTEADVRPALDRAKQFYAQVPLTNPDGSKGIHVVEVAGSTIPDADRDTPYTALRDACMPEPWRGYAHGILIGSNPNGGGQTSGQWSGVSNNWHVIVHELGHQLGLAHVPLGGNEQSPLYASLMNYDYNYGFDGDGDAVQFSPGKFVHVALDETNLLETLPFPISAIHFLAGNPYRFQVRSASPTTSQVDWNRSGTFESGSVRADINDGYAVYMTGNVTPGRTAGAPAIVSLGTSLAVLFPALQNASEWDDWAGQSLSPAKKGKLDYFVYDSHAGSTQTLAATDVTGDPSATMAFGKVFVAYPKLGGYTISALTTGSGGSSLTVAGSTSQSTATPVHPTLVATSKIGPESLWLFLWDENSGSVHYRRVTASVTAGSTYTITLGGEQTLTLDHGPGAVAITSQSPVGAAWQSESGRIELATTAPRDGMQGRLAVYELAGLAPDGWFAANLRWSTGEHGYARTRSRPAVVYDPDPNRGPHGGLLIYHKGDVGSAGDTAAVHVARTTGDQTMDDGWRVRMMGNEWTLSRSGPAATLHRNDIAYAYRWNGSTTSLPANTLVLNLAASGIRNIPVADQDDIAVIRSHLKDVVTAGP